MKCRLGISFLMVLFVFGLMACNLNLPGLKSDTLPTKYVVSSAPSPTALIVELPPEQLTSLPPTPFDLLAEPTADPMLDASQLTLEIRTRTEESASFPKYQINIAYPIITAPQDERLTRFNQEIEDFINIQENMFRKNAFSIPNEQIFIDKISILQIKYQINYLDNGVISVFLGVSVYLWPMGAHEVIFGEVLNYDLLNGTRLYLSDLFLPGSNYLTVLSDYCTEELVSEGLLQFPGGALPIEENYDIWNITPSGLKIYFDPYQVVGFAMGVPEVNVPFPKIVDILRSDGSIGRVITP